MPNPKRIRDDPRRAEITALNARVRACRKCHEAGFLDAAVSLPLVHDPEPDAPLPRILLIGQAPSARQEQRMFAGIGGEKLRDWFERAGIPREDFYRAITFVAITRCYPGRVPGAQGDRVPSPAERALCRPWIDALWEIQRPEIVLLVGLLAIREVLGPVSSLTSVVGTSVVRDGVRFLPLPHPSGVSRWLNATENVAAVERAMDQLREWLDDRRPSLGRGEDREENRRREGASSPSDA